MSEYSLLCSVSRRFISSLLCAIRLSGCAIFLATIAPLVLLGRLGPIHTLCVRTLCLLSLGELLLLREGACVAWPQWPFGPHLDKEAHIIRVCERSLGEPEPETEHAGPRDHDPIISAEPDRRADEREVGAPRHRAELPADFTIRGDATGGDDRAQRRL